MNVESPTFELCGDVGYANISYPTINQVIIGSSCNDIGCSPYRAVLPKGAYFIECYGASGTNTTDDYSLGGHTSGKIRLKQKETLYIYIGQQGQYQGNSTFNGGGNGNKYSFAGGGATDIRLYDTSKGDFESLKSRIMVAAGGGGYLVSRGNKTLIDDGGNGNAGGIKGENGFGDLGNYSLEITMAQGGSQESGGEGGWTSNPRNISRYDPSPERNGNFGYGGNSTYGSGGGGGGYFGGGAGQTDFDQVGSGAGGSSYISGHPKCNSIDKDSSENNIKMKGSPYHFSGLRFTDTIMSFWDSDDRNLGDGYVKITIINESIIKTCSMHFQFPIIILVIYIIIIIK